VDKLAVAGKNGLEDLPVMEILPTNGPHYVVGHRNPDTDSLVCAHVLAWSYGQGAPPDHAIALRLGEANPQSVWLFDKAGIALPLLRRSCRYTA
jgi:hypothetical protein